MVLARGLGVQCWLSSGVNNHPLVTAPAAALLCCHSVSFWVCAKLIITPVALLLLKHPRPASTDQVQYTYLVATVFKVSWYFLAVCVICGVSVSYVGTLWASTAQAGGNRWVKGGGS